MIATKTILQILKNLEWEIRPLQIFATAMSSLSSSMNAGAASFSVDIYDRFGFGTNRGDLRIAR